MKKLLLPLLAVSVISSAYAGDKNSPSCITADAPISFVAKGLMVDATNILTVSSASKVENLSNRTAVRDYGDFTNKKNGIISDATVSLQKNTDGSLAGTIELTELRKAVIKNELLDARLQGCVSNVTFNLSHYGDQLYGGSILLFIDGGTSYINLEL